MGSSASTAENTTIKSKLKAGLQSVSNGVQSIPGHITTVVNATNNAAAAVTNTATSIGAAKSAIQQTGANAVSTLKSVGSTVIDAKNQATAQATAVRDALSRKASVVKNGSGPFVDINNDNDDNLLIVEGGHEVTGRGFFDRAIYGDNDESPHYYKPDGQRKVILIILLLLIIIIIIMIYFVYNGRLQKFTTFEKSKNAIRRFFRI